ncbi:MAG: hypothetical protein Q9M14_02470 [Mariprofundaceae bacterium]|nr:hypothetical protein [Mariprofundaceae bacterium]
MIFFEFINMDLMTTISSKGNLEEPVNKFIQALKERWSFQERANDHSMQPAFKRTTSNLIELTRMFYQEVLKSDEFRDLYISSGYQDYDSFLASDHDLASYSGIIVVLAFRSGNQALWDLFELSSNLVSIFNEQEKEKNEGFRLCEACYRFYETQDWRQVYCHIHSQNRNEREMFSRLQRQSPSPSGDLHIERLKNNLLNPPDLHHNYILDIEKYILSKIETCGMKDKSIDKAYKLARFLTEGLCSGDHIIEIALWKHQIISNRITLKPGPQIKYSTDKIVELRKKGVPWKEIESMFGRSRQMLYRSISKKKTK